MCETTAGVYRTARALWPPSPKFSVDQIPDLTGRVTLVTGANTGVGKETVKALLNHNAKVYLAARSRSRAEAAIKDLKEATGKDAIFLELDLGSLASVRRAAEEFLAKERALHILFNNAGVMIPPIEQLTADGYDLQFGTNVLGHWYFTELLLPALREGAKSSPDGYARVVSTSSSAAHLAKPIVWDAFRDHPARTKLGTINLYAQSKLLNGVVMHEAAKRYKDANILCYACDPGALKTDLQRHATPFQQKLADMVLHDASYGALTQLWAGTMPETIQHNGQFCIPYARLGKTQAQMYDAEVGKRLWAYLEEQVKTK
ncbi:NAD(P)-binding protein [Phanerochaete sordida]|uniref:NAD(P)-binding protein n=1 Tax=Phanerochaete sordida TaxID=48140 RepID=A0A9P3G6G2_9APHY|nr:NAD(P)-binding protein [Phanerochaete sordida]